MQQVQSDSMKRFDIHERTVEILQDLWRRGRLSFTPYYQRGSVWNNERKYALVDSVVNRLPVGLIMLQVVQRTDAAGRPIETFDVIDGQQRLRTMFEFVDGTQAWTDPNSNRSQYDYSPYSDLGDEEQGDVSGYQIPVAYLRNYSDEDIEDLFQRVQFGMALKPGEKLKSLRSDLKESYVSLAGNDTFATDWAKRWARRDYEVMVAAGFLESTLKGNPFQRFEFPSIQKFCTSSQHSAS